MKIMHKTAATAAVAGMMLAGGMAAPAYAQVDQDGLVNVNVGDVTILENVDIAVAANLVATVCNVDLTVAVLVDELSDDDEFTCTAGRGRTGQTITITQ